MSNDNCSRTNDMKVIGLGLSRTGTRSLQYVLELIGFGPSHHSFLMFDRIYEGISFDNSELLWWNTMLDEKDKNNVDWDVAFNRDGWDNCQSAQEMASKYYKELAEYYSFNKNIKFILTKRDQNKWFKRHFKTTIKEKIMMNIIGLLVPYFNDFNHFMIKWIYDIYGKGISFKDDEKEHCISVYNQHNENVEQYFNSNNIYRDRFFVIDLDDGPNGNGLDKHKLIKELQEFLKVEPINRISQFPKKNTNKQYLKNSGGLKLQNHLYKKSALVIVSISCVTFVCWKYIRQHF